MRQRVVQASVFVFVLVANLLSANAQPSRGFRPSGFWTSPMPATHGAYRYRMLLVGLALFCFMGLIVLRAIRRGNAERAAAANAVTPPN